MRLLFWALIAFLVMGALRALSRGGSARNAAAPGPAPAAAENMVRCVQCGVNLPQSDAVRADGGWACCTEHARARGAGRA